MPVGTLVKEFKGFKGEVICRIQHIDTAKLFQQRRSLLCYCEIDARKWLDKYEVAHEA